MKSRKLDDAHDSDRSIAIIRSQNITFEDMNRYSSRGVTLFEEVRPQHLAF